MPSILQLHGAAQPSPKMPVVFGFTDFISTLLSDGSFLNPYLPLLKKLSTLSLSLKATFFYEASCRHAGEKTLKLHMVC